jgi:hypothetical protein
MHSNPSYRRRLTTISEKTDAIYKKVNASENYVVKW